MKLTLQYSISNAIHVGSSLHESESIDVPIVKRKVYDPTKGLTLVPYVPAKVIKGALRRNAFLLCSNPQFELLAFPNPTLIPNHMEIPIKDHPMLLDHPFVTLFGISNHPGKLRVSNGLLTQSEENSMYEFPAIASRNGIQMDRVFQSTTKGALYSYEISECSTVSFSLNFPYLTNHENILLGATLNSLNYSSLGGKSSTGAGIMMAMKIIAGKDVWDKICDAMNRSIEDSAEDLEGDSVES